MATTFYCTHCGTCLALDGGPSPADGLVRCGNCAGLTRVPPGTVDDGVPVARVAGTPVPEPLPALVYVPDWPDRRRHGASIEQAAERLRHVRDDRRPEQKRRGTE